MLSDSVALKAVTSFCVDSGHTLFVDSFVDSGQPLFVDSGKPLVADSVAFVSGHPLFVDSR